MSRTYGEQSFKSSDEGHKLEDELADVLFVLICIANQTNIDLTAALQANIAKRRIVIERDRHQSNPKLNS